MYSMFPLGTKVGREGERKKKTTFLALRKKNFC